MSIIGDRRNKEAAEKRAKEIELMKVSIKKEDVDLIVSIVSENLKPLLSSFIRTREIL